MCVVPAVGPFFTDWFDYVLLCLADQYWEAVIGTLMLTTDNHVSLRFDNIDGNVVFTRCI